MLTRLAVDGFRTFHDFEIHFTTPLTALIGRNGTGKSSILDVLADVGSMAAFGIPRADWHRDVTKPIVRIELDLFGQTVKLDAPKNGEATGLPDDMELRNKLIDLKYRLRAPIPEEDFPAAAADACAFGVGQMDMEDPETLHVTKGNTRLAHYCESHGSQHLIGHAVDFNSSRTPWLKTYDNFGALLHPGVTARVMERLRDSVGPADCGLQQVILATHSPAVINRLYPDEIRVTGIWTRDGGVRATKAQRVYRPGETHTDAKLDHILEEYR